MVLTMWRIRPFSNSPTNVEGTLVALSNVKRILLNEISEMEYLELAGGTTPEVASISQSVIVTQVTASERFEKQ